MYGGLLQLLALPKHLLLTVAGRRSISRMVCALIQSGISYIFSAHENQQKELAEINLRVEAQLFGSLVAQHLQERGQNPPEGA